MRFTATTAALCAAALFCAAQTKPAPPAKPKLVLVVVVDQFRYDYLTRFKTDYSGGLKRLWERGAVWTNAFHEHFPTVTAIGHSAILTGATPSVSGIVGNHWYDRETARSVTSVEDKEKRLVGAAGVASSPHRLLVSTIGDELKMGGKTPSKVIGLSLKDRAAILLAGRMADGAFWFDKGAAGFVTSAWYMGELPAWVRSFNEKPRTSSNEALEQLAEAAIEGENLGKGPGTDLLGVSFSENDVIGHAKGPDSPEVKVISLQTDKLLARLFDFADKRVGIGNVLVVFTADHGVAPVPEVMSGRKMPGGRIKPASVREAVEKALNEKYGEAKWVLALEDPGLYLDHTLIAASRLELEEVERTAASALRALPHIARVYTGEQLRRGELPRDPASERMLNGHNERRGADLIAVPEPYWFIDDDVAEHGTPWNYDAHVPVVFLGPWVKAGRYAERIAVRDIAPTLAVLLEVEVPSGSSGRVLAEMLAK